MNFLACYRQHWWLSLLFAFTLVWPHPLLAAPANGSHPALSAVPTPTPARPAPGKAAADLAEAERAVVRIEATGAFVYPNEGAQTGTGGGSGFIIDPSGLAVTNNHVVTGAAFLKVYVPGEAKPRSAKVLGVDECADLAVIDIAGDKLPYLAWSDEALKVGTPVYAAGYPLLDPEYTLTSGIIGKAQANGQTSWASLDYVLQHDATLNPGNSGGPLLDSHGQIVGINYRGYADANQYFAISNELARPVIEQLRSGVDLNSIGVNGEAITDGKTYAGVWVASVRSGSPADQTGIQPGDFIVEMEGVPVGVDATLESYCNILRGHDAQDVMAVTVGRGQGEVWEGQLNGRPLQLVKRGSPSATEESTLPTPALTTTTSPTPTPEPTSSAIAPALAQAITAAGWDPANGQLLVSPDEIVPITLKPTGDSGAYGQYTLAEGAMEYALHFNVMLGMPGDQCEVYLGADSANPKGGYQFLLKRRGLVGGFFLKSYLHANNGDTNWKELASASLPSIKTETGQFNEVVLTVHGNVITISINGSQATQYTGMTLDNSSYLSLSIWRPSSDTATPACVFRDVQLYLPH